MPVDPNNIDALRAFLVRARGPQPLVCPICGDTKWDAFGPVVQMMLEGWPDQPRVSRREAFPVMALTCTRCAFVRYFSWKAVEMDHQRLLAEALRSRQEE